MITASKLAGFFAAHAILSVFDGETLIPVLAYTMADDQRKMERLVISDDLAVSVAFGKQKLESNEMDANDAVLLYDGRIPLGKEKIDAIIIEIRTYFSPDSEVMLALPYTPNTSGEFRVHKPKLLIWNGCDDFDIDDTLRSFFDGVSSHQKGAKIWNYCLDESI